MISDAEVSGNMYNGDDTELSGSAKYDSSLDSSSLICKQKN